MLLLANEMAEHAGPIRSHLSTVTPVLMQDRTFQPLRRNWPAEELTGWSLGETRHMMSKEMSRTTTSAYMLWHLAGTSKPPTFDSTILAIRPVLGVALPSCSHDLIGV